MLLFKVCPRVPSAPPFPHFELFHLVALTADKPVFVRLPGCKAVNEATTDYFESQATVDMWVEERCQLVDNFHCAGRAKAQASHLYGDYKNWKQDRGEQPMSLQCWAEHMGLRFEKVKANGVRYVGVLLKDAF